MNATATRATRATAPVAPVATATRATRATAPVATAPVATAPVATAPVATSTIVLETAPVATAPVATAPVATAPVATAPVATAPVALSSIVLSRSQVKALAYAEKLYAANELSELALSGNKTDALLHNAIVRREAVKKAAGNNQKIFALIAARNGSDTRFPIPASSKHVDLFSWVAACHALIRGKDDSTEKAIESRSRTVNERFSECFSLIEELRTLK